MYRQLLLASLVFIPSAEARKWIPLESKPRAELEDTETYEQAIRKTAGMLGNSRAQELVQAQGLNILNVTWEDTGRYKNSAVGPNISDMTIQIASDDKKRGRSYLMPVIRYDNFTDRTSDIDPALFTILVGNEKGQDLKQISLREFLEDPTKYLSKADSWKSKKKSLLASRDSKVLISAQACFLPVPKEGKAEFNPVLFNYQARPGDPAVLSILVSNQGTSVTVIDNKRDSLQDHGWGQRLFHNKNGERASLTGLRMADHIKTAIKDEVERKKVDIKKSSGMNMVLLIQVPLKQKPLPHRSDLFTWGGAMEDNLMLSESAALESNSPSPAPMMKAKSNVEAAVIGYGKVEGPFTEIDNLNIERDPNFPIRVTVQFYKATSNGEVSAADVKQIKDEIDGVLNSGENVGSLVVAGDTGRVTEYAGEKIQPEGWWDEFFRRHEENTGETRPEVVAKLRKLFGNDFRSLRFTELKLARSLKK